MPQLCSRQKRRQRAEGVIGRRPYARARRQSGDVKCEDHDPHMITNNPQAKGSQQAVLCTTLHWTSSRGKKRISVLSLVVNYIAPPTDEAHPDRGIERQTSFNAV